MRADRPGDLPDEDGGPHGGVRLHRGLLQPEAATLGVWAALTGRVREEVGQGPDRGGVGFNRPRKRGNSTPFGDDDMSVARRSLSSKSLSFVLAATVQGA